MSDGTWDGDPNGPKNRVETNENPHCPKCKTEIKTRKVLFGRAGSVMIAVCECEGIRIALKYENSNFQDESNGTD